MSAVHKLITDHLDIWTAADTEKKSGRGRASGNANSVYGIKKLRELILELAVRGKLVPQDSNDEPASELLKRIQDEKARLVAEGKIKKDKSLSAITTEERPLELPNGWVCTRLADIVNILNGRAYKKEELLDSGTPVLRVGNLFTSDHWYYSDLELEEEKYCNQGDLLFAWSASFGPFLWEGERSIFHYHIWKLDFYGRDLMYKRYLYTFLLEQTQKIKSAGHGVMMIHMTKEKMEKLITCLPPLEEQHRIVAKVDELMALCDQLEAQHNNATDAHEQLVSHLLSTLTQSQDAADFNANWQRIATHFDTLFTTESSIDALKQTLLQLAVMGKLVPQDPNDEPASELLRKYGIPFSSSKILGWREATLGKLGEIYGGATPSKANSEYWVGEIPWIAPKDMKRPYIDSGEDKVSQRAIQETSLKLIPTGSILMVVRGMILAHSFPVAMTKVAVTINQDMKAIAIPTELKEYLLLYLQAKKHLFVGLVDRSSHGTCKLLSEKLWSAPVTIPPIAEQKRIFTKTIELVNLCDQIKEQIKNANTLKHRLSATLVEKAVM